MSSSSNSSPSVRTPVGRKVSSLNSSGGKESHTVTSEGSSSSTASSPVIETRRISQLSLEKGGIQTEEQKRPSTEEIRASLEEDVAGPSIVTKSSLWHTFFSYSNHVANFGTQYNLGCLSIGISTITTETIPPLGGMEYKIVEPYWAKDVMIAIIFIGCILGMVTMGLVGDFVGRDFGLKLTSFLSFSGIIASALFTWEGYYFWEVLCVSRLLIGFGVGGAYPLAAANAAEAETEEEQEEVRKLRLSMHSGETRISNLTQARTTASAASQRVGWCFFWQSPGATFPYVVALMILPMVESSFTFFRLIVLGGALPSAYVFAATW